jgi:cyclic beta-1,2-glucan synthetase
VWALIAFAMQSRVADVGELVEALNPVRRAATRRGSAVYKVEPYVVAADIYSNPPHAMRGGWTWYTGAAGWLYRALLEHVLGVCIESARIVLRPCLPAAWTQVEVRFDGERDRYRILVERVGDDAQKLAVTLDGVPQPGDYIERVFDGATHEVVVRVG